MKDYAQMLMTLCLFAYIIFLTQCKQGSGEQTSILPKADTTIIIDTILPPPVIVNLPRQAVPTPTIIYIDSSKNIVSVDRVDSALHKPVQSYIDSIEDDNLTLYYNSIVDGHLLSNALDYKLKIPKTITKNITIRKPFAVPAHQLLFKTGLGTDTKTLSSLTVGAQFIAKKGWSLEYEYDIFENSHQVTLGVRIWRAKK